MVPKYSGEVMLLGRLFAALSIISLGLIGCVSTPVKETAKNYPPANVSNAVRAQSPENDLSASASADEINVVAAESIA